MNNEQTSNAQERAFSALGIKKSKQSFTEYQQQAEDPDTFQTVELDTERELRDAYDGQHVRTIVQPGQKVEVQAPFTEDSRQDRFDDLENDEYQDVWVQEVSGPTIRRVAFAGNRPEILHVREDRFGDEYVVFRMVEGSVLLTEEEHTIFEAEQIKTNEDKSSSTVFLCLE